MVSVDKLMAEKKSAKVVLVNPPPPTEAFVHYQNPLIGLAYMAAVLENNGHRVTLRSMVKFTEKGSSISKRKLTIIFSSLTF